MGRSALESQFGCAEEVYANEVQRITITGTPTGGTFTLTFDGATTAAIAFDAAAAAVETALELLPNIDDVTVSGGALPDTAVDVTFSGNRVAGRNVPEMTADDALLTGGSSPTVVPSTVTPGTGYGDFVAPDRFYEFVSEDVKNDVQQRRSAALRKGNTVQRTDRTSIIKKGAAGPLTFEVANKGFGRLWKHAIGDAVISTPGGATNTRDHTHTIGNLYNRSLVGQFGKPDTEDTDNAFSYLGTKVTEWELTQELDSILMLALTLDCFDETTSETLATASYLATQELFHDELCQPTIDGANVDFKSLKIKGTNALKTDRHFIGPDSRKKQPIKAGEQVLEGEVVGDLDNLVAYNRFVNGTIVPVVYTWTGTLIEATFNYQLILTMPACRFTGETPGIDGPDVIEQTLPFEVLQPASGEALTLVYRTIDTAS